MTTSQMSTDPTTTTTTTHPSSHVIVHINPETETTQSPQLLHPSPKREMSTLVLEDDGSPEIHPHEVIRMTHMNLGEIRETNDASPDFCRAPSVGIEMATVISSPEASPVSSPEAGASKMTYLEKNGVNNSSTPNLHKSDSILNMNVTSPTPHGLIHAVSPSLDAWIDRQMAKSNSFITAYIFFVIFILVFLERMVRQAMFGISGGHMADTYSGITLKSWMIVSLMYGFGAGVFPANLYGRKIPAYSRSTAVAIAAIWSSGFANVGYMVPNGVLNIIFRGVSMIPIPMFYGIMYRWMEGRRCTEMLVISFTAAVVLGTSAGVSFGQGLVQAHIDPSYVPALISVVALPVQLLALVLSTKIPPPSAADRAARTDREAATPEQSQRFYSLFLPGLICLVCLNCGMAYWKNLRAALATEMFAGMGLTPPAWLYFVIDLPGALVPVLLLVLFRGIKSNRSAFFAVLLLMLSGFSLIMLSTIWFKFGGLNGYAWMALNTLGPNLVYVGFYPLVYDKLVSAAAMSVTVSSLCNFTDLLAFVTTSALVITTNLVHLPAYDLMIWMGIGNVLFVGICIVAMIFFSCRLTTHVKRQASMASISDTSKESTVVDISGNTKEYSSVGQSISRCPSPTTGSVYGGLTRSGSQVSLLNMNDSNLLPSSPSNKTMCESPISPSGGAEMSPLSPPMSPLQGVRRALEQN